MFIRVQHLAKQVPLPGQTLTILRDVNLTITKGEAVGILGVSGSGKSTLLGLLAGLDLPSAGEIWIEDIQLGSLDEAGRAMLRSKLIGFIFQNFLLIPSLTALENVMLALELKGEAEIAKMEEKASAILDKVGLKERMHHLPRMLSGGEQQRVAIARAFVTHPQILFADEPTANLDKSTAESVIQLLFDMNEQYQTTLIFVTHDPAIATRCNRIFHLENGSLV